MKHFIEEVAHFVDIEEINKLLFEKRISFKLFQQNKSKLKLIKFLNFRNISDKKMMQLILQIKNLLVKY